jgi:hypothetical protein
MKDLQLHLRFHLFDWYLVPFRTNPTVGGLYQFTWLCLTVRATWRKKNG